MSRMGYVEDAQQRLRMRATEDMLSVLAFANLELNRSQVDDLVVELLNRGWEPPPLPFAKRDQSVNVTGNGNQVTAHSRSGQFLPRS